jgi:hypothetical protein
MSPWLVRGGVRPGSVAGFPARPGWTVPEKNLCDEVAVTFLMTFVMTSGRTVVACLGARQHRSQRALVLGTSLRTLAGTEAVAKTARHNKDQLRLFDAASLDRSTPSTVAPAPRRSVARREQRGARTKASADGTVGSREIGARRDGATRPVAHADVAPADSDPGTVSFVGPDGCDVPVDALRRIVGLMIDQARHSPGRQAS